MQKQKRQMVSDKIWSIRTKHFHLKYNVKQKNIFPNDVERTVSIRTPQLLTIFWLKFECTIYFWMLCLKIARWEANSASHLGLHCLPRPVCPNTYDKYSRYTHIGRLNCTSRTSDFFLVASVYNIGCRVKNKILVLCSSHLRTKIPLTQKYCIFGILDSISS